MPSPEFAKRIANCTDCPLKPARGRFCVPYNGGRLVYDLIPGTDNYQEPPAMSQGIEACPGSVGATIKRV